MLTRTQFEHLYRLVKLSKSIALSKKYNLSGVPDVILKPYPNLEPGAIPLNLLSDRVPFSSAPISFPYSLHVNTTFPLTS